MVEVFRTNITDKETAGKVAAQLLDLFPGSKINFDLEDIDCILRVESNENVTVPVAEQVQQLGYFCEALE